MLNLKRERFSPSLWRSTGIREPHNGAPLHSLTRILANKQRKLVKWPGYNNYAVWSRGKLVPS